MKHTWSKEEIRTSSEYFIKTFIVEKRRISLTEAAYELHNLLPNLEIGTLKMHLSNSKFLADTAGLTHSATFASLENASKMHKEIFQNLIQH